MVILKKEIRFHHLLVSVFSALFACVVQGASVETARGIASIEDQPQNLIAFPVGVIDTLDALGVKLSGMPEGVTLDYIDQPQAKVVGTLFSADLETIQAIQPDLVIIGTRSAKQYDKVNDVSKVIDLSLSSSNTYRAGIERMHTLAHIVGKEAQAEQIEHELDALKKSVQQQVAGVGKVMVVMIIGRSLNLLTEQTRIDWFAQELGMDLVNADNKQLGELAPISFEFILAKNPDWLIVIDRDAAIGKRASRAQQQMDNPLIKATTAYQQGQLLYLDGVGTLNSVGGVQGLKHSLLQLQAGFAKDQ